MRRGIEHEAQGMFGYVRSASTACFGPENNSLLNKAASLSYVGITSGFIFTLSNAPLDPSNGHTYRITGYTREEIHALPGLSGSLNGDIALLGSSMR